MPTRKPSLIAFGFAVLGVLLGLYAGAYYAMVKPRKVELVDSNMSGPPIRGVIAEYRVKRLKPYFAPAEWLDRRVRSTVWEF
jgi:hypothetical protein